MSITPIVLCGGAGTRLWPASRAHRPKPFLPLTGERSPFQETVTRLLPLARPGGRPIVVAGRAHRHWVAQQLAELDAVATVLLEPEGRDSAPAMAAAALWANQDGGDRVLLFAPSDHHIPDPAAFRAAVRQAQPAARSGRIVTLGVRPRAPSCAYGYIRASGPQLGPAEGFIEKPTPAEAERLVAQGWLWNSGVFIVTAATLLDELTLWLPEVLDRVSAALPRGGHGEIEIGDVFRDAPRASIDRAVMERTRNLSVLPVDLAWSDLGAWDAVAATGTGDRGIRIGDTRSPCLVRAAEGMVVVTTGVSNLVIVAEPDAVLVCDLGRAQEVKGLVEQLPKETSTSATADLGLGQEAERFSNWINLNALPIWASLGVDADGGFREALALDGRAVGDFRRARVQTRQAYVFCAAGRLGWQGPWRERAERGLERFEETNLRPDGLYRTRVAADGAVLDETASLYDQAFALFAFAAASQAGLRRDAMSRRAHRLATALDGLRVEGGWREAGPHPFQANAHMHLLEAFLAWEALEPGSPWSALADSIVDLARRAFIDPSGGFLREFYTPDWAPAGGADGDLVEPGHQFEWAWLLTRWGRSRRDPWAMSAARRLYTVGQKGIDASRGVAFDELHADLTPRSIRARLWPQTERLKAALILAEETGGEEQARLLADAAEALAGLQRYLEPTGLWRDRMEPDGRFVDEPAPASSFYHIMAAYLQLRETAERLPDATGALAQASRRGPA